MKKIILHFILLLSFITAAAQDSIYIQRKYQFISYNSIPTWTGVATGWNTSTPAIHLYNAEEYKGHAEYISRGLKTGITFKQFKENVKHYEGRKYLPFFLYDLRDTPVLIDEIKYIWAVRIEDYGYEDSPAQMAETVNKLFLALADYTKSDKGIVVLASSSSVKPNTSIASALKEIPTLTLTQLIERTGSAKTQVLNPGTAYGYLRYAPADSNDQHFKPSDIVIYEKLPTRVPPVAGFITLEPQTPLSHVNLLAMNRGTINIYTTGIDMLPGAKELIGKPVKITCTGNRIMITKANAADVEDFLKKQNKSLSIPVPDVVVKSIIDLAGTELIDVKIIGAKAYNYALLQEKLPQYTRPGLAIPFSYYADAIKQCGADTLINGLLAKKDAVPADDISSRLIRIRAVIETAKLDTGFITGLYAKLNEKYPGRKVRLRSSTNCEDLPGFNGAGLYTSAGFNTGDTKRQLEKALLKVFASLWNEEAFYEREFYHINHLKASMAVLINEAYENEYANGVAITVPSKNGEALIINSQPGDELVTNPRNGQIPESIVFDPLTSTEYRIQTRSNISDVFVKMPLQEHGTGIEQLASQALLLDLRLLVWQVQQLFHEKYPSSPGIDMEFKLVKEHDDVKIYIKQARPFSAQLPQ